MESRFDHIEIGRRFVFAGMTFTKVAPGLAADDERLVHVFMPEIFVEVASEADEVVIRTIPVFRIKWADEEFAKANFGGKLPNPCNP